MTSPLGIARVAYTPRPEVSVCPTSSGSPATMASKLGVALLAAALLLEAEERIPRLCKQNVGIVLVGADDHSDTGDWDDFAGGFCSRGATPLHLAIENKERPTFLAIV